MVLAECFIVYKCLGAVYYLICAEQVFNIIIVIINITYFFILTTNTIHIKQSWFGLFTGAVAIGCGAAIYGTGIYCIVDQSYVVVCH